MGCFVEIKANTDIKLGITNSASVSVGTKVEVEEYFKKMNIHKKMINLDFHLNICIRAACILNQYITNYIQQYYVKDHIQVLGASRCAKLKLKMTSSVNYYTQRIWRHNMSKTKYNMVVRDNLQCATVRVL